MPAIVGSGKRTPVGFDFEISRTVSRAPPASRAITGVPQALASNTALAAKLGAAALSRAAGLPGEQAAVAAALALYQRVSDG